MTNTDASILKNAFFQNNSTSALHSRHIIQATSSFGLGTTRVSAHSPLLSTMHTAVDAPEHVEHAHEQVSLPSTSIVKEQFDVSIQPSMSKTLDQIYASFNSGNEKLKRTLPDHSDISDAARISLQNPSRIPIQQRVDTCAMSISRLPTLIVDSRLEDEVATASTEIIQFDESKRTEDASSHILQVNAANELLPEPPTEDEPNVDDFLDFSANCGDEPTLPYPSKLVVSAGNEEISGTLAGQDTSIRENGNINVSSGISSTSNLNTPTRRQLQPVNKRGLGSSQQPSGNKPKGKVENVVLSSWKLKKAPARSLTRGWPEWIVIGGFNSRTERLWHSSLVTERINARTLKTSSGSIYHLENGMDEQGMKNNGFGTLCEKFSAGFPEDWDALIMAEFKRFTDVSLKKSGEIDGFPTLIANGPDNTAEIDNKSNQQLNTLSIAAPAPIVSIEVGKNNIVAESSQSPPKDNRGKGIVSIESSKENHGIVVEITERYNDKEQQGNEDHDNNLPVLNNQEKCPRITRGTSSRQNNPRKGAFVSRAERGNLTAKTFGTFPQKSPGRSSASSIFFGGENNVDTVEQVAAITSQLAADQSSENAKRMQISSSLNGESPLSRKSSFNSPHSKNKSDSIHGNIEINDNTLEVISLSKLSDTLQTPESAHTINPSRRRKRQTESDDCSFEKRRVLSLEDDEHLTTKSGRKVKPPSTWWAVKSEYVEIPAPASIPIISKSTSFKRTSRRTPTSPASNDAQKRKKKRYPLAKNVRKRRQSLPITRNQSSTKNSGRSGNAESDGNEESDTMPEMIEENQSVKRRGKNIALESHTMKILKKNRVRPGHDQMKSIVKIVRPSISEGGDSDSNYRLMNQNMAKKRGREKKNQSVAMNKLSRSFMVEDNDRDSGGDYYFSDE